MSTTALNNIRTQNTTLVRRIANGSKKRSEAKMLNRTKRNEAKKWVKFFRMSARKGS
jgi:hypothetical protein